jgi:hypothetical protein
MSPSGQGGFFLELIAPPGIRFGRSKRYRRPYAIALGIGLTLVIIRVGTAVCSEESIPEKVDHCEVAVRVQVMDEVELLLAPEPGEAAEFRSFDVVFLVKVYVGVERRCARDRNYEEQPEWKYEKHPSANKDRRDKKVRRVVSLAVTINGRHKVAPGIVRMMKSDVIPEENAPPSLVAKAVVEKRLAA